jgi:hypothetical protein
MRTSTIALAALVLCCKPKAESKPQPPPTPGPVAVAQAQTLKWTAPEGWIAEAVTSPMRRAQYRLARAEGDAEDAECIVHYFGPGQGGMVEANVSRWLSQLAQPDGRATADVAKVEKRAVNGVTVTVVEASGTYAPGAMGPMQTAPEPKAGWALVGAIVETPSGPWFFKLTGPQKTAQKWRASFDALVASLQPEKHP